MTPFEIVYNAFEKANVPFYVDTCTYKGGSLNWITFENYDNEGNEMCIPFDVKSGEWVDDNTFRNKYWKK